MYHIESMRTALINVARVRPGTSEGITDLLLPQSSSVLKRKYYSGRPSFPRGLDHSTNEEIPSPIESELYYLRYTQLRM